MNDTFTQDHPLGIPREMYGPNRVRIRGVVAVGIVLIVVGLVFLFPLGDRLGPSFVLDEKDAGFIICFFLFFSMGLFVVLHAYINSGRSITVHEHGVNCICRDRPQPFLWSNIKELYESHFELHFRGIAYHISQYTLGRDDGARFTFSLFVESANSLAETIWQEVNKRLFQQAVEVIDTGKGVRIGKLEIYWKGILYNGTFLPWDEIAAIKDNGSMIWINRKGMSFPSWFCENRASIPNVPLFHMLVDKYRNARTGE